VHWPSQRDLYRFQALIGLLYVSLGHKKAAPQRFWNMVKAVDKRWQKLWLQWAVTGLVERSTRTIPLGPRTRIAATLTSRGKPVVRPNDVVGAQPPLIDLLSKALLNQRCFRGDLAA